MIGNVPPRHPYQVPQPDYSIVQQIQDLTQNPQDLWRDAQEHELHRQRELRERSLAADMFNRANQTSQNR